MLQTHGTIGTVCYRKLMGTRQFLSAHRSAWPHHKHKCRPQTQTTKSNPGSAMPNCRATSPQSMLINRLKAGLVPENKMKYKQPPKGRSRALLKHLFIGLKGRQNSYTHFELPPVCHMPLNFTQLPMKKPSNFCTAKGCHPQRDSVLISKKKASNSEVKHFSWELVPCTVKSVPHLSLSGINFQCLTCCVFPCSFEEPITAH